MRVLRKRAPSSLDESDRDGFRDGDAAAVARVEELVTVLVRSPAHGIDPCEQGDVVQQVLLAVWKGLDPSAPPVRSFDGFVRTIAYRACIERRRARRRRHVELAADFADDLARQPDASYEERERLELAGRVLAEMRRPCRELFQLLLEHDLGYREIAARQGRTVGAVRTQMCQCLKEARQAMRRRTATPSREPS